MLNTIFRKELPSIQTIVVKTGSRILTAPGHEQRVHHLIEDLALLRKAGLKVVLVSSGAIAHGMRALKLEKRPTTIPMQQACASIGQNRLMHMYDEFFAEYEILIGQVLLTWDDLRNKKRYLNLRNTLFQLLDCGVLPIVNENDSVGVEEIQFGNNDVLGAQISLLVHADLFVNLTDVGGLYNENPRDNPNAQHIPLVKNISEVLKYVADGKSEISVGGMSTKLKAAAMVTKAGIYSLVGDGFEQRLRDVLNLESAATLFLPNIRKMPSRSRWIAFTGQSNGSIAVDDGAANALTKNGKSLLPAGIKSTSGSFKAGEMVDIVTLDGSIIARGLTNFSSIDIVSISGCNSSEISERLGEKKFDEVVHRDNLVLIEHEPTN